MMWIEFTESDGHEGAARWGDATDEQIDKVLAFAEQQLGKPDTLA